MFLASLSPSQLLRRLPSSRVTAYCCRPAAKRSLPFAPQRFFAKMNPDERAHYLADSPPSVVRLEIEAHFEALSDQQKRYAHFISK